MKSTQLSLAVSSLPAEISDQFDIFVSVKMFLIPWWPNPNPPPGWGGYHMLILEFSELKSGQAEGIIPFTAEMCRAFPILNPHDLWLLSQTEFFTKIRVRVSGQK